ncbi:MAG TPA: hypothetical protein VN699_17865 [Pirellulales bacterium]|nr:hypothetical protein [Pirellulales bacterium]
MEQTTPAENPFQSPAEESGGYSEKLRGRDSELGTGDWILAALCGGIACILGIVWMIQGKPKGIKMVGISILFAVIWNVLRLAAAYLTNSL